ncbi:hypothetical protein MSAN_01888200 [Mycena sanguinolenta]|uniref:Rad60/SUMO-like domain-containing protein n=1 Tax=Mycena sanguinolenta TaxID=230812 RepID=A0A8H7CQN1_9AGAR|nr:hypothetical protein MSAN_01888200 [Mycena sanguinolenta]
MASNARPRPRPRPRAKEASSSTDASSKPQKDVIVVDDDAMFIRKRNPVAWKRFQEESYAPKPKAADSDSEHDSDSPRPRKQKKKSGGGDTAQAKINRLMSETLSDDSDSNSDVVMVGDALTPKNKRKKRSRSRSITPPPPVPKQQVQMAKDLVRTAERTPSPPPDADDSTDTILLDPELQEIMHQAAARAQRSHSEPVDSELAPETLEITVKWIPHPLNESGQKNESIFKLNRTDNFRDLFEAVAEDESVLVESLVMSYKGRELIPAVTPAALDLWGEAELQACDKTTWDYIRAHPTGSTNPIQATEISDDSDDEPTILESDAESDAGGETFKLVLQSKATKSITLTVRPTTTCGAIVQAFLKKAGLADKYNLSAKGPRKSIGKKGKQAQQGLPEPQLVIDGDKMAAHVPIGDMDLDDGDTVDVVGL